MRNVWSVITVGLAISALGVAIHTRVILRREVEKAVSQREADIVDQVRGKVNMARVEMGLPPTEAKSLADVVHAIIEPLLQLGP